MATLAPEELRPDPSPADMRLVITASSLGTIFEWYDFFIYGTLAASGILGRPSSRGNETAADAARLGGVRGRLRLPPAGRGAVRLSSATGSGANTPSSSRSR